VCHVARTVNSYNKINYILDLHSVETLIEITFSKEEVAELQTLQTHPHHVVRRNALMLILKSKTIPHHKIAQITDVCENTVRHCFETYRQGGIEKIKTLQTFLALMTHTHHEKLNSLLTLNFQSFTEEQFQLAA